MTSFVSLFNYGESDLVVYENNEDNPWNSTTGGYLVLPLAVKNQISTYSPWSAWEDAVYGETISIEGTSNLGLFSLVEGEGDDDNDAFYFYGISGWLCMNQPLDFETKSTYTIRIKASPWYGQEGTTIEESITISVLNLPDEQPSNIFISHSSFNENISSDTIVATISSEDLDIDDTHTYSLVSGDGDADNSAFTIDSNQLKIIDSPDFEIKSS